ncbi:MAG: dihydropteroate synthase [Bacteroidota bacterium]
MKPDVLNLTDPIVMGILNLSPDSFYDGGKYTTEKQWMQKAEEIVREGAQIIDIGAVSTKPGSELIAAKEEAKRLEPALKKIRKTFPETLISVDTYNSETARLAVAEGADMINDVSGGTFDNNMFKTISELKKPYVLMHINDTPDKMQKNPAYDDVVETLIDYFRNKIHQLNEMGFDDVILDPGFGFGKTISHNYRLMKKLRAFSVMGYPLLVGISRKSMINNVLNIGPENALNGTTILNTIALTQGANILRVHDVKPAVEAIALVNLVYNA